MACQPGSNETFKLTKYIRKIGISTTHTCHKYARYICETSDISMEYWYVSHIYLTSCMVLSSSLQLSKMPYLREHPNPGFVVKEIAGLSENVSASCNNAQHWTRQYKV